MRYKLLLVSLMVVTAFAAVRQGSERLSRGATLTNHWAMAALFWSSLLDSTEASGKALTNFAAGQSSPAVMADSEEEFRWQGRVQPGQTLEVKGVNGNVRAEGYSGNQVEVVATKRGRRSDPKEVEIRVVEHAGGVTICAVYPSDGSRPNDCQVGNSWRTNVRNNDVSVDFTVRVPTGVRFMGRTVNGGVEAERIGADVDVATVNGSINVSASGIAQASTVNGSIRASMGSANWANELRFNTINGSITLDFPSGLGADLRAETLNGDVTSDFPLNAQGPQEERRPGQPRRVQATIGGGGRSLVLKTINGDIRLTRGGGVAPAF
ncbi:MAG TPA: DUF4097 family beta strand repeat-containing protein [Pyrinomonadaceae bacterium]|nr:DUF4097 family beta strand repeat-containing protein [Pyrinomonadaceae bacterium]